MMKENTSEEENAKQAIGNCPICDSPANKTTLHLIPWFIIKYYITQGGSGLRDKELSFTISTDSLTKVFAGRSVLPETLEEFGDLHDLEKEKDNPYTRDYLWCAQCERKFSRLEAIFSTEFSEKKKKNVLPDLPRYKDQAIWINTNIDNTIFQLFVQSIFWRCSIGRLDGFSLKADIESKILYNLREAFKLPAFMKLKSHDAVPLVNSFPLIASVLHTEEGEDPTKNFVVINKVHTPYFIMAGKWLFQLFEKEKHIKGTQEGLYGLRMGMDLVGLFPKIKDKSHLTLLNSQLTEVFSSKRLKDFSEKKLIGLQRNIRLLHNQFFGHKPDAFISSYILRQYFVHQESGKTEFESFVHAFYDLKKLT